MKKEIEYIIKASPKVLFTKITTAAGLQQWFADKVSKQNEIFSFTWLDEASITFKAKIEIFNNNDLIRFYWQDFDDKSFIEFRIITQELTNDVILIIKNWSNENLDFSKDIWDISISKLKYALGDNNN